MMIPDSLFVCCNASPAFTFFLTDKMWVQYVKQQSFDLLTVAHLQRPQDP